MLRVFNVVAAAKNYLFPTSSKIPAICKTHLHVIITYEPAAKHAKDYIRILHSQRIASPLT